MSYKKNQKTQGQALLEFALILTVLLMMIFLIVESARILWAWNQVQNAAREGARFAITGRFDEPCSSAELPKFADICDGDDKRVASIINATHKGLSGLPLNETSGIFEDDYYYQIEIWGIDSSGVIIPSAGLPNTPVVVRTFYRVPIITPLLQPIVPSVPVFGQVTMNNESFGQLGGDDQGQGVPPELPPIPTVGVTPSPTFTPTPSPTPTEGPTSTSTSTLTPSPTATPDACGLQFEGHPIAGEFSVGVTGEIGYTVEIFDLTSRETLGFDTLKDRNGHVCPGFASFESPNELTQALTAGHQLLAVSDNPFDKFDTAWVLDGTATATPTATNTTAPTPTASNTPTPSLTPTPGGAYIELIPQCASGPNISFNVNGGNWPQNESINLYWDTTVFKRNVNTGSFTFFNNIALSESGVSDGEYDVYAISANHTVSTTFSVPCGYVTPIPSTPTPTGTPEPADLLIVGPPELISAPPIIAYQPVDFRVVISNTGDIPVESQFFVDIYLDPTLVLTTTIPISQSGGFQGVGSLAGGESRVITITSPLGFSNTPEEHSVYGMVDSLEQINESDETNNISVALLYDQVTPAATPTPSATPAVGDDTIYGVVYRPSEKGISPLTRATVTVVDAFTSEFIASTKSHYISGFYFFDSLPPGTYNIIACGELDNINYSWTRTGINVPFAFPVNLYTQENVPCP